LGKEQPTDARRRTGQAGNPAAPARKHSALKEVEQELERERGRRIAAENALQQLRGRIDERVEAISRLLLQAIDDHGASTHFHNPAVDDEPFGDAVRCWLYNEDCAKHPHGAGFGDRIRICSECETFRGVAIDSFTRAGELLNAVLFLLHQRHRQFMDTQQHLVQSEKLAGLGELAAGLAHEINNPTGIILSRLDCMELDPESLPALIRDDLDVIRRHAERLQRITKSLTSFARRNKVEKRVVVLQDLLYELVEITERTMDKGNIFLRTELPEDPMVAFADPIMVQQVFMNIILNARDAMPNGGTLSIGGAIKTHEIVMTFKDTGSGMAPEVLARVFDPFFTTKETRGTGLGLSVSYGIVKDHGGQIEVESEPGAGALFRVSLPRHRLLTDDIEE
jgi:signal transduction histidine kinase